MFFIGIDLAWCERNATGIAVLKGNERKVAYCCGGLVYSNKEIIDYIKEKVGGKNCLIAIDAPLTVQNESGQREAERLAGKLFGKYDAKAYPVNRKLLRKLCGKIRGEELSKMLGKAGFEHSPKIKRLERERKFFEVFTHSGMIVLFKLSKTLKYKARQKRSYEFRWREFKKYQDCLKKLKCAKPSLSLPKEIAEKQVKGLKGLALKNYEDLLDAVFCAYTASYCWANPGKCRMLGSMKTGYILTPVFDSMQKNRRLISSCSPRQQCPSCPLKGS